MTNFIDLIIDNVYNEHMLDSSEKKLIERIKSGDATAETELFRMYGVRIARKVSYNLGPGNADWRDVAGDVQMAVLISLRKGQFDETKGMSLGAYIYGITTNKIRDYFKTQKKRPFLPEKLPEGMVSVAEAFDVEKKEMRALLNQLLSKLKLKYKEVLYLRYFEELSVSEISKKLNLPPRRVSERINYALKLARKKCENKNIFSILALIMIILIWTWR